MKDKPISQNAPQGTAELTQSVDKPVVSSLIAKDYASKRTVDWGERFRKLVASCLVLSLGIILAYHFYLFWTLGSVIIEEPNKIILLFETLMSFAIIAFGVELFVRT